MTAAVRAESDTRPSHAHIDGLTASADFSGKGQIRGVIFDSDGTLVDSEILSAQVVVEMVAEQGITMDAEEALQRFRGCEFAKFLAALARDTGLTELDAFTHDFRVRSKARYAVELQAMPNAVALVQQLRVPKSVASNGPRDKLDVCLRAAGLIDYFPGQVFSAYEVGAWKPDPALILHAASAMGVAPAHCLLVEDSVVGIEAGLAAGVFVVGYRLEDDVKARLSRPVPVIEDMMEILEWLAPDAQAAGAPA
jgi:HAD superfamily hydrolase (TIGR01509 family)